MNTNTTPPPAAPPIETTEDDFLGGRIRVLQVREGSRAGLDAVFLAAACPAMPGQSVLDAGTGSGIVALAVAARVDGIAAVGVEIDPALARLAELNAARNGLAGRARFVCGDVTGPASALMAAGLALESFDHVLANPPYLANGENCAPPGDKLRRAHICTEDELAAWVRTLAAFCRAKGTVTIVHRADALPKLLGHLERRFGALVIYPLFPREGAAASRILIQGRKGSRAALTIARGMVLHGDGNGFAEAAEGILRRGERLDVGGALPSPSPSGHPLCGKGRTGGEDAKPQVR